MLWSLLTVCSYTISSLGDKYISSRMKCKPSEFAFIVSSATTFWLGLLLPFKGWQFEFTPISLGLLALMVVWKMMEFYSSALLLKIVSAYELKAWLGINIIISYVIDIINGSSQLNFIAIFFSGMLLIGITMIIYEQKQQLAMRKLVFLSLIFITSKFMYGFQMNMLSKQCSSLSTIFLVMLIIALIQFTKINKKKMIHKKGMPMATLSRVPNAIGLLTEAITALQSVFLYAMIQPMQLTILFVYSIARKEKMGKIKLIGSILSIISVSVIAIIVLI